MSKWIQQRKESKANADGYDLIEWGSSPISAGTSKRKAWKINNRYDFGGDAKRVNYYQEQNTLNDVGFLKNFEQSSVFEEDQRIANLEFQVAQLYTGQNSNIDANTNESEIMPEDEILESPIMQDILPDYSKD